MMENAMENSTDLLTWPDAYHGKLYSDPDPRFPSDLYGFENVTEESNNNGEPCSIPTFEADGVGGGVFGYVHSGRAVVNGRVVVEGQWFTTDDGAFIALKDPNTRMFAVQRRGWKGWNTVGGPIENKGRLRYIDGCTDSLLASPIRKGDACLNHLHFPGEIDQTQHTHPSLRCGIVTRGSGECRIPSADGNGYTPKALSPGMIFVIPTDGVHAFSTLGTEGMDVIPYHPDSDFGPEDEHHPMVNRTLVEGAKLDNTQGRHAVADLENSSLGTQTGN